MLSVRRKNTIILLLLIQTSLFMAVLGEIPRLGGFIRTSGKFGYISQVPWVYNGTVRDNILFGADMDRRKYNKALFSCVLLQVYLNIFI